MKLSEKIMIAAKIFHKNPSLFLKLINYRLKRLTPSWRKTHTGVQTILIDGVYFDIDFDLLNSNLYAKQLYYQCYELHMVEILKKFLKKGGRFIDVGANIGYISALGASLVGPSGSVHSFEPVPAIFLLLEKIVKLNPGYNITLLNKAIGENNELININCTSFADCGGSSAVQGFLEAIKVDKVTQTLVETIRLDDYFASNQIDEISLIKIDVEGYEFSALKGLEGYFSETPYRPPIVCEIAPSAIQLLGHSVQDLWDYLSRFGYQAFDIYDHRTKLLGKNVHHTTDILFVSSSC